MTIAAPQLAYATSSDGESRLQHRSYDALSSSNCLAVLPHINAMLIDLGSVSTPSGPSRTSRDEGNDEVWREAPVLVGTTQFTPRPDVRNIMITGGAGFMYETHTAPEPEMLKQVLFCGIAG